MSVVTVYAIFADAAEAERIGMTIIEEKLAACVNILAPCRSIYRWEGGIETATETPALFKTTTDKTDALIERVKAMHSYSVAAIFVWPIERLSVDYAEWVEAEVR